MKSNFVFGLSTFFYLLALGSSESTNLRGLLDISFGDTSVSRNEGGEVTVSKKDVNYYCKSFPEGKSKEDISVNLLHSISYNDYIGSSYFQASYNVENTSKDKNICGIKIEVPGSEDMDVFISTGVKFEDERTDGGDLKSNLVNDSVFVEPGNAFVIFYTLSEDSDMVKSTKVPRICIQDYDICSTEEINDRMPLENL